MEEAFNEDNLIKKLCPKCSSALVYNPARNIFDCLCGFSIRGNRFYELQKTVLSRHGAPIPVGHRRKLKLEESKSQEEKYWESPDF